MCFGGSNTTSTTVNQSNLPAWVSQAGMENFSAAREVASRPFEAYGGQRTAGFTPMQNQAGNIASSQAGNWMPLFEQSVATTRGMSDPNAVRGYMNPYVENALNPQLRVMQQQRDAAQRAIAQRANSAGAYGDARHGLLEAKNYENWARQLSDTTGQAYTAAFDRAMSTMGQQAALYGQAASNQQQMTSGDVNQLFNLGAQQRQVQQSDLDAAYGEYLRRINWPAEQLNLRIGALSGTPYAITQNSTTSAPGGNTAAQAIGATGLAAGGVASLWRAFNPT